jgi:hypothetical protein
MPTGHCLSTPMTSTLSTLPLSSPLAPLPGGGSGLSHYKDDDNNADAALTSDVDRPPPKSPTVAHECQQSGIVALAALTSSRNIRSSLDLSLSVTLCGRWCIVGNGSNNVGGASSTTTTEDDNNVNMPPLLHGRGRPAARITPTPPPSNA